jgi:hypothetical protein
MTGIADDAERQRLQAIPTGLTIPDADVDALVAEGAKLIQANPVLLGLISDLDARLPGMVTANRLPPVRPAAPRGRQRLPAASP